MNPLADDPPDLPESLKMLLEDTRRLSDLLPAIYRLSEDEERQLAWLLEWARRGGG